MKVQNYPMRPLGFCVRPSGRCPEQPGEQRGYDSFVSLFQSTSMTYYTSLVKHNSYSWDILLTLWPRNSFLEAAISWHWTHRPLPDVTTDPASTPRKSDCIEQVCTGDTCLWSINDIHESQEGVAGVSEVEICPIFLTIILPRIRGEKDSP